MTEPLKLQWVEKTVPLNALIPFEKNPRRINKEDFEVLKTSLESFGQFRPLLATHDMRLAGGHQRLRAMRDMGWTTCRVSVPDGWEISNDAYMKLVILDNHNNGFMDMDMLADGWDFDFLKEIRLKEVMNFAEPGEDENGAPRGKMVCCPECKHEFAVKGNGVK